MLAQNLNTGCIAISWHGKWQTNREQVLPRILATAAQSEARQAGSFGVEAFLQHQTWRHSLIAGVNQVLYLNSLSANGARIKIRSSAKFEIIIKTCLIPRFTTQFFIFVKQSMATKHVWHNVRFAELLLQPTWLCQQESKATNRNMCLITYWLMSTIDFVTQPMAKKSTFDILFKKCWMISLMNEQQMTPAELF